MNLEARKLEFIREFLKLQSEEAISRFEKLLKRERKTTSKDKIVPLSLEELNSRIDQSESDFQNKRYKSSKELLKKFE